MTYTFTDQNSFPTMGIEWEGAHVSVSAIRRRLENAGIDWVRVESEHCGAEIVFPPCPMPLASSDAYMDIKAVLDICEELGADVQNGHNCGGHVHLGTVSVKGMTPNEYWQASKDAMSRGNFLSLNDDNRGNEMTIALVKDVVRRYAMHQDVINEHLPASRTGNSWCMGLQRFAAGGDDHNAFEATSTVVQISNLIHRNGSKYHAINLRTWNSGTIEFRQGASYNEIDKWGAWMELICQLFTHSDHYRLDHANGGVMQTPERLHRRGSRLDVTYQLCRREGGSSTRDIMAATGCTPERIRAMITEIRQHPEMSDDAVQTLTQQHYNHRYGSSGGAYDLGGYMVHTEITRANPVTPLLPDNRVGQTSVFAGLDDASFEVLAARRLDRIRRGTLTG